jgi:hypothetical protein
LACAPNENCGASFFAVSVNEKNTGIDFIRLDHTSGNVTVLYSTTTEHIPANGLTSFVYNYDRTGIEKSSFFIFRSCYALTRL